MQQGRRHLFWEDDPDSAETHEILEKGEDGDDFDLAFFTMLWASLGKSERVIKIGNKSFTLKQLVDVLLEALEKFPGDIRAAKSEFLRMLEERKPGEELQTKPGVLRNILKQLLPISFQGQSNKSAVVADAGATPEAMG